MSFKDQIEKVKEVMDDRQKRAFVQIVMEAHSSIVEGSEVTGAPGQPVQSGDLKRSFDPHIEGGVATIASNLPYAYSIEIGFSMAHNVPITYRSEVGGPHSIMLTEENMDRIVEKVMNELD